MPRSPRPLRSVLAGCLLAAAPAGAASPLNLTVLGHIPDTGYLNGVFVHDNLLFHHRDDGNDNFTVECYDVSDPANPVHLSSTPIVPRNNSLGIPDMHGIYYTNGLLFTGVQTTGGGFVVFDYSDPRNPVRLAPAPPATVVPVEGGVHTLRYADGYLYVMPGSFSAPDIFVFDVHDPSNPVLVNQLELSASEPSYCHDLSVMEGVGYASFWNDGMKLIDLSSPATALPVLTTAPSGTSTHSAWPSADRRTVVTCHEANNIGVKFWDMTQTPPVQTGAYQSHERSNNTTVHDVMVVGRYAYITYYRDGVRILDLSQSPPAEVGSYITDQNGCSGSAAYCSGISQWVENGRLYTVDMANGVWIFDFTLPHDAPITVYAVKRNQARDVELSWNHTGEDQYTVRRGVLKDTVTGDTNRDVDGRLETTDAGVVPDGRLYYYRVNGPWQGRP